MIGIWKNEWINFKTYYKKHFFIITAFFFLSILITYLTLWKMIEKGGYEHILLFIEQLFKDGGIDSMDTGYEFMFLLLINNMIVCAFGLLLGFIPIIILPYLLTIYNGVIVGIAIKVLESKGYMLSDIIFLGLAPHGITELIAMFLAMGISSFVSVTVAKKPFKKKVDNELSLYSLCKMVFMSYVTVIAPLLLVSAFIESFVTVSLFSSLQ